MNLHHFKFLSFTPAELETKISLIEMREDGVSRVTVTVGELLSDAVVATLHNAGDIAHLLYLADMSGQMRQLLTTKEPLSVVLGNGKHHWTMRLEE